MTEEAPVLPVKVGIKQSQWNSVDVGSNAIEVPENTKFAKKKKNVYYEDDNSDERQLLRLARMQERYEKKVAAERSVSPSKKQETPVEQIRDEAAEEVKKSTSKNKFSALMEEEDEDEAPAPVEEPKPEPKKEEKKPQQKKEEKKPQQKKEEKKPEPKKEEKKPEPKVEEKKKPEPKKEEKKAPAKKATKKATTPITKKKSTKKTFMQKHSFDILLFLFIVVAGAALIALNKSGVLAKKN
ncbi:hypothetical protein TVAG_100830 [Trichomonas vaginalis G3]|uniref:Uncharacterized protein n=1 Tax=Trichomonas vaginalis (strain ATCC PRA-98 / G3) TaxID=412133 RepID=A2DJG7_TRIV3|nr:hypothetical protein TVAGG3_1036520 [Trichomonas vaginalis G3]EAY19367.1 hypothetical protein TVAG_100830 [Trichomonas vaginalis G3]KAI5493239.1 hypothetical protein TVAGG3_1036520 [Trichomonas vaginalis G3]|eukprot:XP_001580353.1 hypothetical protein [Trichomonas vaginalis G3]